MNLKIQFISGKPINMNIKSFSMDNKDLMAKIIRADDVVFDIPLCDIKNLELENKKKEETPEDPADALPWSMNQYRTVVDAIIALASVSGDLSILANNPKLEMSNELREELDELIYQLKRFDGDFTFEF